MNEFGERRSLQGIILTGQLRSKYKDMRISASRLCALTLWSFAVSECLSSVLVRESLAVNCELASGPASLDVEHLYSTDPSAQGLIHLSGAHGSGDQFHFPEYQDRSLFAVGSLCQVAQA